MSTENVEVFNKYLGNGVATQFSIGFPYQKKEFIKVYLYTAVEDKETLLPASEYEFIDDVTIKYPVQEGAQPLQEGDILTIQRETELGSNYDFDNQRRLFPAEVMNADDLAFQQIQELSREIKRSVRVTPTAKETPEELLTGVYDKLDSATSIAGEAIAAAGQATIAAEQATTAVEEAKKQVIATQEYVDEKRAEIDTIVAEAEASVDDAITQATEDVKQAALEAAQESINTAAAQATAIVMDYTNNEVKPQLNEIASNAEADAANAAESAELATNEADEAKHWAEDSRVWATGEDAEVEEIAPGEGEHSSRGYADLAMAIANTPEDVPVDTSKLLALEIIKGPKGDAGSGEFSGDVQFEGSFNVHGDDNHPVKVTSLAGASASGFQVVDSNGAGESDFEHAATGDRYITRIANKSTATGKTVNVDLYQTTAGKSVLDLSKPDTILAPQLLDVIFPIGSYYLSEEDSCPLADWMDGCQWEKVGTSLVSGTEAAVVGNGNTLGLINNVPTGGTDYYLANNSALQLGFNTANGYTVPAGVSKDPEKSGIVANLPTITVNIFRRTM